MNHSFKFIYIIAIVAVIMIVVTMGLYIMSSSQNYISTVELSDTEVDEFNVQWKIYEGLQKGSTLRGLFLKLEQNAEENATDATKLIDVAYNSTEGGEFTIIESTTKDTNAEEFLNIQDELNVKRAYVVEFVYDEKTELITGIIIKYGRNDSCEFVPNIT